MTLDSNGSLGIGTTTPSANYNLDVNGYAHVGGGLDVDGAGIGIRASGATGVYASGFATGGTGVLTGGYGLKAFGGTTGGVGVYAGGTDPNTIGVYGYSSGAGGVGVWG